jgi:hypothetical protein
LVRTVRREAGVMPAIPAIRNDADAAPGRLMRLLRPA